MRDFFKRYKFNIILIIIAFLCWGRLLTLRGIWWDDWSWVWHYFDCKNLSEYFYPWFSLERPMDGLFMLLNFKLFDIIPQAATNIWNIEKFLIFLINAILLYRIAKFIFHANSLLPEIIAIVYLVSPLVNIICLTELTRRFYLCFFLTSILFSIKSINNRGNINKYNYLAAILLSSLTMFHYENFICFDLLRPLIIFYILTKKFKEKTPIAIKKAFFYWLPFVIIGSGIALYKSGLIIPRFGPYAHIFDPYHLPVHRFIGFTIYCYVNSLYYLFIAHISHFIKTLPLFNYDFIVIILSALTAIFVFFFIFKYHKIKGGAYESPHYDTLLKEARLVAFIGIFLTLLGIAPYPLAARYLEFGDGSRHALLAGIGVVIFVSSALLWLYYKGSLSKWKFCILLASIVFLGTFECNDTIKAYNNDWQQQRSFWWQFVWRVPAIKDKTLLIVDMPREETEYLGSGWCGLYEFGGPLNLLYAKSNEKGKIYNHFGEALQRALFEHKQHYLKNWKKEEVLFDHLVKLRYYPRNLLLASYHKGYLYLNHDINRENSSRNLVNIEPLVANSSGKQVIYEDSEINYPLRAIIGPEPRKIKRSLRYEIIEKIFGKNVYKDWRYYFQKIKVLEHLKDYKGIVDLYDEAEALGWNPRLPQSAPICVVKSLYLTGNIQKANFLLLKWALSFEGDYKKALDMLEAIKNTNNDPKLYAIIEKEINAIWRGLSLYDKKESSIGY